jgi:aspartate 1-decarboxylase
MMKGKIHRATVTETDLHYEGSIGIDRNWMDEAGLLPNEQVHVVNVNNGERLVTYVIEKPAGSKTISLNGAAARKAEVGDIVIIIAYATMTDQEARQFQPRVVLADRG